MLIYSFPVFPIAYLLRNPVRRYIQKGGWRKIAAFPLWITLNDRYMDYGETWWLEQKGGKKNFKNAWLWSWSRNNSDNWNYYVVRKKTLGKEVVIKSWTTDGRNPLLHRRLKWEYYKDGEWKGDWTTNQGDRLNQYRTWLGTAFCVYGWQVEDGVASSGEWRFSHAGIWLNLIMANIKLGYNQNGEALFDWKFKIYNKKYTEHWV